MQGLARLVFGTLCHLAVTVFWPMQVAHATTPLPMREVAPGIYVHSGLQALSDVGNQGDIANIGFIVGERCVAVIDSGGSILVGQRLFKAVRAVTTRPVCYVINTHVHPDHIFGNAAFLEASDNRPVFVGHARLAAAMASHGATYRRALLRDLGDAVAGSEIVPPTLEVKDTHELDLGGRVLRLRAWPTAHTDADLTIYDETTGTLWLSDLLFVGHIPVVDGSLRGWLGVIREVSALNPRLVVTGHGTVGDWRHALDDQERYLRVLLTETRAAIKGGVSLPLAVESVGRSEKDRWLLFDDFHRRNVTAAYAELEWED